MTFSVLIGSGEEAGDTFFSNPLLALTLVTAAVCALAGGVVAGAALLRGRPVTPTGRVALWCIAAIVVTTGLGVLVEAFSPGVAQLFGVLLLPLSLAAVALAGYARLAQHDRAALLAVPLLVGVVVAIFVVGESLGHE